MIFSVRGLKNSKLDDCFYFIVSDWRYRTECSRSTQPAPVSIFEQYKLFSKQLPAAHSMSGSFNIELHSAVQSVDLAVNLTMSDVLSCAHSKACWKNFEVSFSNSFRFSNEWLANFFDITCKVGHRLAKVCKSELTEELRASEWPKSWCQYVPAGFYRLRYVGIDSVTAVIGHSLPKDGKLLTVLLSCRRVMTIKTVKLW
jgi:hypothetical protein